VDALTSEEYFRARQVLLDALQALEPHLEALILVGAQAVYLHTGDSGLAVAPTTTDADLAIDAALLSDDPNLVSALAEAGFSLAIAPGTWKARDGVAVDLMVPEAQMANVRGRRGARLGVHGNTAARRTAGLEPALTDNTLVEIGSLRPEADTRSFTIKVAGPAALLVAKLTKMRERASTPQRLQAKDGLDVLRILQVVSPERLAEALWALADKELAGDVTRDAIGYLRSEGTRADGLPARLAVEATVGVSNPDTIAESMKALVEDLLDSYGTRD
jgi:hypothetical protein